VGRDDDAGWEIGVVEQSQRVTVENRGGVDGVEEVGVVLLGCSPVVQGLRKGRGSGVVLEEGARPIHEKRENFGVMVKRGYVANEPNHVGVQDEKFAARIDFVA
jgi:hypothetical protein